MGQIFDGRLFKPRVPSWILITVTILQTGKPRYLAFLMTTGPTRIASEPAMGREKNIPTPTLETLASLVKGIESHYVERNDETV